MHSLKKTNWYKTVLICQNKSHPCLSQSMSAVVEKNENKKDTIVIPNRIERGPTDILKALSQTLQRDPLAPHFKYHDDPFTIPVSNMDKRSFALAQESGKKAAQWIRAQHADCFNIKWLNLSLKCLLPNWCTMKTSPLVQKFCPN
ncbi:hypothetical protein WDU94_012585 [Cyamophila willieti]